MQKKLSLFFVFILIISILASCDAPLISGGTNEVNYYVDGQLYATQKVISGTYANSIQAPKKDNQIFVGWYIDPNYTVEFDFSTNILLDVNLYAYYVIDAISATELMTNTIMKSVVTIMNKSYNTGMGGLIETESLTAQGSGVVIDISGGYCYVLTNAHVVAKADGYSAQALTVEDAWGNEFSAKIYQNPNSKNPATDNSYDLALICFKHNTANVDEDELLAEINLNDDPKAKSYVVSLGTPNGQKNAITYGSVLTYTKLAESEDENISDISFDIIVHNATIHPGSSGGPLLNTSGELVGLNFAGRQSDGIGCAIPVSRIREFLNVYVYLR